MKYQRTERFISDYQRLSPSERELFRRAVREMNKAYEQGQTWPPSGPASLRIRQLRGAPGVWEMTWSFTGPPGRATFEVMRVDGEPAIKWRRLGGHEIFGEP